ncbi:MAG: flavin reductase [Pseudomonadota bacterium]
MANDTPADTGRALRDALSAFATGVTIITARDGQGEPIGMTASSFNSVSMEPPLILWSVTKTAWSGEAFRAAEHFAVHVLASDQSALSNTFARPGEDKFGQVEVTDNAHGVPVLADTAARFDCRQWAVYEGGDHWIIVGEVVHFERQKREGLVFCNGGYATSTPIRPPRRPDADTDAISDAESEIDSLLFYQISRSYRQMARQVHAAVLECGLTLPEWRILASLEQGTWRSLSDLSGRTFVEPHALPDMLASLAGDGLCALDGDGESQRATGTARGEARVAHLLSMSRSIEKTALAGTDEHDRATLDRLLKQMLANTDS